MQHGQVVPTGGVGSLGQFAGELAVAGQDDQPPEIHGNGIIGKGLLGSIAARQTLNWMGNR